MGEPVRPKETPAVPITELPEVKAAFAEAASRAAAEAIAAFANQSKDGSPSLDAQSLLNGLALAIAEISHQGNPKDKPVDPKVLAERRAATERMYALIDEAQALPKGDPRAPLYRTRSVCMFNDFKIDPYRRDPATKRAVPVEFRWRIEPNDAMIPLNDLAKRIYAEFRASRGNKAEYEKQIRRQVWLTDSGLVVEGVAPARREVSEMDRPNMSPGDLEFSEPDDPNAEYVRVLGTTHEPARQAVQGAAY